MHVPPMPWWLALALTVIILTVVLEVVMYALVAVFVLTVYLPNHGLVSAFTFDGERAAEEFYNHWTGQLLQALRPMAWWYTYVPRLFRRY